MCFHSMSGKVKMLRWNHKEKRKQSENNSNANTLIILLMIMSKLVLRLIEGCRVSYENNVGFKS